MEYLLFTLIGLGVGIFGTLVGIGGGLICVPLFIFAMTDGGIWPYFTAAPQIVGTSLFIVLLNALSGSLAYLRQRRVFMRAAIPFALATLPGAFFGSYIADTFNGPRLYLYFGAFQLSMSIIMYWNATHKPRTDILEIPPDFKFNAALGIVSSMGVGFISSMFGIGGGVIHVPLLVYLLGFPVHIATATSQFILMISSAIGVVSHFYLSHIIWPPAIGIGLGATIGAQLGAKISRRTRSKVILVLLSCAMFALGVRLIFLSGAL